MLYEPKQVDAPTLSRIVEFSKRRCMGVDYAHMSSAFNLSGCFVFVYEGTMLAKPVQESRVNHISLASFLWDIGNQCIPKSDAAETRRLIRISTVCLQNVILKFE